MSESAPRIVEAEALRIVVALTAGARRALAIQAIRPADVCDLRMLAHVQIVRAQQRIPYIVCSIPGSSAAGVAVVHDLHPAVVAFLSVQECARRFAEFPPDDAFARRVARQACDVAALCILYSAEDERALGRDGLWNALQPLRAIEPEGWFERFLPHLLCLRRRVIETLAGSRDSTVAPLPDASIETTAARQCALASKELRERTRFDDAQRWAELALDIAAEEVDAAGAARAWMALGAVRKLRGGLPRARECFRNAARVALRSGELPEAAMALHDWAAAEIDAGQHRRGHRLATRALALYGADHPLAPILAHDIGTSWMDIGRFEDAFSIYRNVLPHIEDAHVRMLGASNMARAAGAVGNVPACLIASNYALDAASALPTSWACSRVCLNLAHASLAMRLYHRAATLAEMGIALSADRGEAAVEAHLATALDDARRHLHREPPLLPCLDGAKAFSEAVSHLFAAP